MMEDVLNVIIARLLEDADDATKDLHEHPGDLYCQGVKTAYYMVLDTIKNTLLREDWDPADFGLDMDLDKKYL